MWKNWRQIFLWIFYLPLHCHSVDVTQRDQIICNFLNSTNIASLKTELQWTGWECDGDRAIDLCGNKFWTAVMCQGDDITQLLFEHKGIIGTIPSEFGLLTDLVWIDFTANSLFGTIPESLGLLSNLVELTLGENSLVGSIPSSLGDLTGLLNLELTDNSLTGTLPPSLGQLTKLVYLTISETSLHGSIPETIGSLGNLERLELTHNSLSGPLPNSFTDLHKLQIAHLENNLLSSSLPTNVTGLSSLRILALENNQLTGTLSLSFLTLQKLQLIRVFNNLNVSFVNVDQLCEEMRSIEVIEVADRSNACYHQVEPVELHPGTDPTWHQPGSSVFPLLMVVIGILLIVGLLALDHHCRDQKSYIDTSAESPTEGDQESRKGSRSSSSGQPAITRNPILPTSPSHSYSRSLMYGDDDDEEDLHIALQELNSRRSERQAQGSLHSLARPTVDGVVARSDSMSEVEMGLKMSLEAVVEQSQAEPPNPQIY
jgi:hypothetical protein